MRLIGTCLVAALSIGGPLHSRAGAQSPPGTGDSVVPAAGFEVPRPMLGFEVIPTEPSVLPLTAGDTSAPPIERIEPTAAGTATAPASGPLLAASRLTVRHEFGDGVGYRNGFTYLEGFLPIWQAAERRLLFADLRVVNFDDVQLWEFNAGGGFRWVRPGTERVFGMNAFYDGRRTRDVYFNQIGVGLESLGPILDVRANFYFPLGQTRQQIADTGFGNPRFVANNVALERTQTFDVAMRGFDTEFGGKLPILQRFDLRGYLGHYHYDGDGMSSVDGIRGRLEAQLTRNSSLHFTIQNDRVFNTTVSGGVAFHWGGSRTGPGPRTSTEVLGQRVVRDVNIVLAQDAKKTDELAIDPTTGRPIIVTHANSAAAPGGDGTVERPFQTLAALQAGSTPGNILFAHAGSVFTIQQITLQNAQRFLGEGIDHYFSSTRGTFLLPRATTGSQLPTIADALGRAIVLASNTEVSGFVISNSARTSIYGKDISNINVNRNEISGSDRSAIRLIDVSGKVDIVGNKIFDIDRWGIRMVNRNSTSATVNIANNELTNIAPCGCYDPINITLRDSATWNGAITNNRIDNAPSFGIYFSASDKSSAKVAITRNEIKNIGIAGIFVSASNNAYAEATINRNTITDISFTGIILERKQSAFARYQVANNTLDNLGGFGLLADSGNKKNFLLMQIIGNTSSADFALSAASGSTNFLFEDPQNTNTFTNGIVVPWWSSDVQIVPPGSLGFPQP